VHDLPRIAAALPRQYPYFLDSAAPGPLGQYSLLLRTSHQHLSLESNGDLRGPGASDGFLARLDDWYQQEKQAPREKKRWPFTGG
jgi:hypothetical protein